MTSDQTEGYPTAATRASVLGSLQTAVETLPGEHVSLGDVAASLGHRALPLAVLLFALPNCIPAPPGLGSILGLPLMALGLCLVLDRPLWLPGVITRRTVRRADLVRILSAAQRRFASVESALRPRLAFLVSARSERLIGAKVMVLAAAIALPVPLTNLVPAIGTALIAFGLVARDGLVVASGIVVGLLGLVLAVTALASFVIAPLMLVVW